MENFQVSIRVSADDEVSMARWLVRQVDKVGGFCGEVKKVVEEEFSRRLFFFFRLRSQFMEAGTFVPEF